MGIELVPTAREAILLLTGDFDLPAVSRVCAMCDRLAQTDAARKIVLDFSRVRLLTDPALAALAHYQAHVPPRLELRGLPGTDAPLRAEVRAIPGQG